MWITETSDAPLTLNTDDGVFFVASLYPVKCLSKKRGADDYEIQHKTGCVYCNLEIPTI